MHYPEDEFGPVMSLAVDRNHDLWINTAAGGTYRLTRWPLEPGRSGAGQKAWRPGSVSRR